MGEKKNVSATATAGSSGLEESDKLETLVKEVAESRIEIDQLRFQLSSLSASISLFKSKNKNVSPRIKKLKTLNNKLVTEVAESRKQIDQLRFELASLAADKDILARIERDVFRLILSSSLDEEAARSNADMAAMMKKADSAGAQLNVAEMLLLALVGEKDAIQMNMERLVEERVSNLRSLEQAMKVADPESGGRIWKKWIYPITVSFCVGVAVAFCSFKGFNIKNSL